MQQCTEKRGTSNLGSELDHFWSQNKKYDKAQARSAYDTERKAHRAISGTYNEREKERYNTVQARSSYDTERKALTTISGTYNERRGGRVQP